MTGKPSSAWLDLFRNRDYLAFWLSIMLTGFAVQIQTVSVGWYVYDLTRNPLDLGLIGLSQFLPALLLVLVTGSVADRFSRPAIMGVCLVGMSATGAFLLFLSMQGWLTVWPIFVAIALFGIARAFYNPARQSIVPNLVPAPQFASAIAASSTGNQFATISGPAVGGLLYAISPQLAYCTVIVLLLSAASFVILGIKLATADNRRPPATWSTLSAGFRFIWLNRPLLGAMSLDLFAMLFAGAVALLPVYARDILDAGPVGLGLLRSGPAVGAIAVSILLIIRPISNYAGPLMFLSVVGFAATTIAFAYSTTLWLSVALLVLIGAFDMISVNIRSILVQLWTPDELRGRVNAVNQVFIGASNEVSAFRAGVMAVLVGPVAAVALGGAATLAVAGIWARAFPSLRKIGDLK